jgi:hypothetical protein
VALLDGVWGDLALTIALPAAEFVDVLGWFLIPALYS